MAKHIDPKTGWSNYDERPTVMYCSCGYGIIRDGKCGMCEAAQLEYERNQRKKGNKS